MQSTKEKESLEQEGSRALETASIAHQNYLLKNTTEDLNDAISFYVEAIKKNPSVSTAYYRLASLLYETGQITAQGAIEQCRQAVLIDPDNADAHMYLGYFLGICEEKKESKEEFAKAIKLNPMGSARARVVMALTLLENKKDIKNMAQAFYCMFSGSLMFLVDKAGLKMFFKNLACDFNYLKYKTVGKIFETVHNDKKAYETYCEAIDNTKCQTQFYEKMANIAMRRQRPEVAHECYKNALLISNNEPECIINTIEFVEKNFPNNHDELIDYYNALLKYNPNFSRCYYEIGHLYIKKEEPLSALNAFRLALDIESENPFYQNSYAYACVQLEQYDEALKYYKKAYELNPDNEWTSVVAQAISAIYHQIKGDYNKALDLLKRALELSKNNKDEIYQSMADIYYEQEDIDEALKYYLLAVKTGEKNARAYSRLAMVYWECDNIEEAISYYIKAINIDPNYDIAYNNLGVVFLDGLGDAKRALGYLENAIDINPNYVLAHFNCARAYEALDMKIEAANRYQSAMDLNKIIQEIEPTIIEERLFRLFDI